MDESFITRLVATLSPEEAATVTREKLIADFTEFLDSNRDQLAEDFADSVIDKLAECREDT